MTVNARTTTRVALDAAMDRRKNGDSWEKIAKDMGMPESTLRGRLRIAGLLVVGGKRGPNKVKQAARQAAPQVAPAAGAVVSPSAPVVTCPPPTGTSFVTPTWYPLLKYAMGHEKGATLFGPRGCGKSTAIRHLAAEKAQQTITLQCAANMQIDSLLGSWTSEKGTLKFIDGPLTEAVRMGAWLLAEEANAIHPGVWSAVNTLTDATGEGLRLPTGETVAPNPNFRLVLIYNEGYAGTREVNAALKDRLMPIYCGYLATQDEIDLLVKMTGASEDECRRVVGVADMIRAANLRFDLSPRSLSRWIRLVKLEGLTWEKAYEVAIVDLVGAPGIAGPQRACLEEIGRNSVSQWSS